LKNLDKISLEEITVIQPPLSALWVGWARAITFE